MRKTLKNTLTGSMVLTVAIAMVIVSVCLLLGTMRYGSSRFSHDVGDVFTTELLTELNMTSTGTAESAAVSVEQVLQANAGNLGIGTGREYSIWDVESGNCIGGTQSEVSMTDNIITAMRGEIGDTTSIFPVKMDIAIPINGEVLLVLDIVDDGKKTQTLCWNIVVLLVIAFVLSMLAAVLISRLFADAFASSAVETAREVRNKAKQSYAPTGDWEALAIALYEPKQMKRKDHLQEDVLDKIMPYLGDGYVKFHINGDILAINSTAEHLLGVTFDVDAPQEEMLTFAQAFGGVPMPNETQSMVHGMFTRAGLRLEVYFVALEPDTFGAVLRPANRGY